WTPDAQPYSEESQPTQEVPGTDGKSAVWTVRFGSVARNASRAFTWSGSDAADAPARGVTGSPEDSFSPTNSSTRTFDVAYLKVDSDQAIAVAEKHGGDKLLKKDPKIPVYYRLRWDPSHNNLVWNVMFGGSGGNSKLNVQLDATTGSFIKIEK
ncbi:MAG TPA: PepSY domain-containing protein, partial [Terriglobales bacterium]|nr:PepSY domain-containing protein [Terriglobales bacterium]